MQKKGTIRLYRTLETNKIGQGFREYKC